MEQPQTIGDEHQPDVEWDPSPALNEKFRYISGETMLKASDKETVMDADVEWDYVFKVPPSKITRLVLVSKTALDKAESHIKELEADAALGALLRRVPEFTFIIHNAPQYGFQWEVLTGDFGKPDYYCYGSTPEEALRNLFQCMAGES